MKIGIYISSLLIMIPLVTYALGVASTTQQEVTTLDTTSSCKRKALIQREKTMRPILRAYVVKSEEVTTKTKNDYDRIKWYTGDSYSLAVNKIEQERNQAMAQVNQRVAKVRLVAQATWRAEDALCDYHQIKTASETSKKQ